MTIRTDGRPKRVALFKGGELISSDVLQTGDHMVTAGDIDAVSNEDEGVFLSELAPHVAAFPALPDAGWLVVGAVYIYEGDAVMVRQSHNRTEHPPADVPALFMVHRTDATSLLDWVAGEQVHVGTRRMYGGKEYECLQAHVTQADWTPPAVAALWKAIVVAPPTGAWAAGVAYKVNDQVTYNGKTYKCLQAHTSISTWYPSVVPALWQVV